MALDFNIEKEPLIYFLVNKKDVDCEKIYKKDIVYIGTSKVEKGKRFNQHPKKIFNKNPKKVTSGNYSLNKVSKMFLDKQIGIIPVVDSKNLVKKIKYSLLSLFSSINILFHGRF